MITEKDLIEHCSPTLSGLKTASLFSVKYDTVFDLHKSIKRWNDKFASNGVKVVLLKKRTNTALVYLYRAELLKKDFENKIAKKIMQKYGYNTADILDAINKLQNKLLDYDEFPHEIGLFLGYPPKDVDGFICNKGQNCNLCGYWKVYGDTDEALQKFAKYDKCKAIYKKLWQAGRDIMQLTVKKQLVA